MSPTYTPPVIRPFKVQNEPILNYEVGSNERLALRERLEYYLKQCEEIPIVIGDKHYKTGNVSCNVCDVFGKIKLNFLTN